MAAPSRKKLRLSQLKTRLQAECARPRAARGATDRQPPSPPGSPGARLSCPPRASSAYGGRGLASAVVCRGPVRKLLGHAHLRDRPRAIRALARDKAVGRSLLVFRLQATCQLLRLGAIHAHQDTPRMPIAVSCRAGGTAAPKAPADRLAERTERSCTRAADQMRASRCHPSLTTYPSSAREIWTTAPSPSAMIVRPVRAGADSATAERRAPAAG